MDAKRKYIKIRLITGIIIIIIILIAIYKVLNY